LATPGPDIGKLVDNLIGDVPRQNKKKIRLEFRKG
jgi:hypothetical protein